MKLSEAQIQHLAETVYGQLHQQDERQWPNWGTLTDADRNDFTAYCYAWLATFRQGQKLELAFEGVPGLVWQHASTFAGVPLGERNNYLQLELPVLSGEMKIAAMAVMEGIAVGNASRTEVQTGDSSGKSETERSSE